MPAELPADWLRAVLPGCVLAVIGARGESYGYIIGKDLSEAGLAEVAGGTLYPLLRRLESDGAVSSRWENAAAGPGRKYYELTDQGRTYLDCLETTWAAFAGAVSKIIAERNAP